MKQTILVFIIALMAIQTNAQKINTQSKKETTKQKVLGHIWKCDSVKLICDLENSGGTAVYVRSNAGWGVFTNEWVQVIDANGIIATYGPLTDPFTSTPFNLIGGQTYTVNVVDGNGLIHSNNNGSLNSYTLVAPNCGCHCEENDQFTTKPYLQLNGSIIDSVSCGGTLNTQLQCNVKYDFAIQDQVIGWEPQNGCNANDSAVIRDANGNTIFSQQNVNPASPISFAFTQGGPYSITYYLKKNGIICKECKMNFIVACNTSVAASTCCPPFGKTELGNSLKIEQLGNITSPYTIKFQTSALTCNQLQSYINYYNLLNPSCNKLVMQIMVEPSQGPGGPSSGPRISDNWYIFTAGSTNSCGSINLSQSWTGSGFNNLSQTPLMVVNQWYKIVTWMSFEPSGCNMNAECRGADTWIRISTTSSRMSNSTKGGAKLEISDGSKIIKTTTLKK